MATCLALWTLGMIIARSCSLTAVAWALTPTAKQKFGTLRERLRDLYREGPAKAGKKRRTLDRRRGAPLPERAGGFPTRHPARRRG
jgi:hypothetical protein